MSIQEIDKISLFSMTLSERNILIVSENCVAIIFVKLQLISSTLDIYFIR